MLWSMLLFILKLDVEVIVGVVVGMKDCIFYVEMYGFDSVGYMFVECVIDMQLIIGFGLMIVYFGCVGDWYVWLNVDCIGGGLVLLQFDCVGYF